VDGCGVLPHCYQPKKSKYPKTKKLTPPGENVHFFVLGRYKTLNLMGMYGEPFKHNYSLT
ncbi:hypothetical protein, partial [Bacillus cereus]|uniref:hypothetical protein n=1 Tax=Bacillus cereus TaxID=1396 RepID=UPI000BECE69C